MRILVAVFAALLTLGLVAFGVVVAQKDTGSAPVTASAAPVASSQNTVAAAGGEKAPQQLAEATNVPAPFAPTAVVQNNTTAVAPAFPAPTRMPMPVASCINPDALGLSRVIEIDTTGGPAFGTEHFKQYDFLRDKEVALTFDDGPWPGNTPMVLKALQDNCTKATFFEIGEHATWRPDLAKELAAAGMTIGPYLVTQGLGEEPLCQGHRAGRARNRNGRKRRAHGGRRTDRAILSFSRFATTA